MVKTWVYENPQIEQQHANYLAEIGDFVEQDEEIATIETDKVHIVYLPRWSSLH